MVRYQYLILIDFAILKFGFTLLLKCDDNQGHEYVDEEERKNDEVNDVENGHFNAKILYWTLILVGGRHRMLKHSVLME